MSSILYVVLMVAIWAVNLLNGTGLGNTYQTTEYAKIVVYFITIIIVILEIRKIRGLYVEKDILYSFGAVVILFVLVSWYKGYGFDSLDYLWAYLLIYVIGKIPVSEKAMQLTGLAFGVLGLAILYIFDYGTALSGWNTNSIGMIGLHSFLIFIIPFFRSNEIRDKFILIISTGGYLYLINPTNSRSSMLFVLIGGIFALSIISAKILVGTRFRIMFALLIPLLISIFVISISNTGLANSLNMWSIENYSKPLFNGRDGIWLEGLRALSNNLLIGTGFIQSGHWHNCAIACLVAYGIVGYFLWTYGFYNILKKTLLFSKDLVVFGCAVSFLILFAQQSVELGIFARDPNILPYLMLGILLGRVRYLRENNVRNTN